MLGIIGGTSLLFSTLPSLEKRTVSTPFGSAEILSGDIVMLMRHQHGLPPHRINHRAHLAALAIAGVDRIVAFGSSGSLKPKIKPGSLLIPYRLYQHDRYPVHPRSRQLSMSARNSQRIFTKKLSTSFLPHGLAGCMCRRGAPGLKPSLK